MKAITTIMAAASLGFGTSAQAALLAYEGFDYTPGQNVADNTLNGGSGFAGAWTVGQQGGKPTIYDETAAIVVNGTNGGELAWDGVVDNLPQTPGVGSRFVGQGPGTADRITADRVLSQSAGVLAGADNTLWASYALHMTGTNFGRHVGFSLGSNGMAGRSVNIDGSGDGIGVGGAFNTGLVTPTIWLNGSVDTRTTTGATSVSFTQDNIIILKFEFGATDTVTAYRFTESDTLSEVTFDANAISATAAIDEATLNVLSFSQSRGTGGFDEFRLGDSFDDVIGIVPVAIPEPSSTALLGLGGLALMLRRRRA